MTAVISGMAVVSASDLLGAGRGRRALVLGVGHDDALVLAQGAM